MKGLFLLLAAFVFFAVAIGLEAGVFRNRDGCANGQCGIRQKAGIVHRTFEKSVKRESKIEVPVTVALPQAITGGLTQAVQQGVDSLRGIASSLTGVRQWE